MLTEKTRLPSIVASLPAVNPCFNQSSNEKQLVPQFETTYTPLLTQTSTTVTTSYPSALGGCRTNCVNSIAGLSHQQQSGNPLNGDDGLPVTESREHEAARSLLDLAQPNCNAGQTLNTTEAISIVDRTSLNDVARDVASNHQKRASIQHSDTSLLCSELKSEVGESQDEGVQEREKDRQDAAASMDHRAKNVFGGEQQTQELSRNDSNLASRKRMNEFAGFEGVCKPDSLIVEQPPRKKSSCVRIPQIESINEESPQGSPFTEQMFPPPMEGASQMNHGGRMYRNMSSDPLEVNPHLLEPRHRSLSVDQLGSSVQMSGFDQRFSENHVEPQFTAAPRAAGHPTVRDQPMDLRVVSTRTRRLEILPGGIVSQPPLSFVRESFADINQAPMPHGKHFEENDTIIANPNYGQLKMGDCSEAAQPSRIMSVFSQPNVRVTPTSSTSPSTIASSGLLVPKQEFNAEDSGREVPVQSPHQNSWPQPHPMGAQMGSGASGGEEGKCVCNICHKTFQKMSQLRMHVNIHYFERPFRCDACAKSFRTRGHLQKHKRSVSHFNRVNMNLTFGTPTADNPRPFKCDDCKIAFRIHGHLAKHLRSKAHIMKLECLGKLPFGMYAELERSGVNLGDIDTTDCENSLESLQVLAQRIYQQEPCSLGWKDGTAGPGDSDPEDDGLEAPLPPMQQALGMVPAEGDHVDQAMLKTRHEPQLQSPSSMANMAPSPFSYMEPPRMAVPQFTPMDQQPMNMNPAMMNHGHIAHGQLEPSSTLPMSRHGAFSPIEASPQMDSLRSSCTCHFCGKVLKSAKSLQVHLHTEHADEQCRTPAPPTDKYPTMMTCHLCGEAFDSHMLLSQHFAMCHRGYPA